MRTVTRRQVLGGLVGSMATLGLAACARRAPEAAPPVSTGPTPAAAPTGAPVAVAPTPQPKPTAAAGPPRRGGMLMTATQTDWITFDNIYNSANGSATLMVFDPLFFLQLDDKGTWRATPGLIEKWDTADTSQTWYLRKGVTFHDGSPWN